MKILSKLLFPGISGIITVLVLTPIVWFIVRSQNKLENYNHDPKAVPGAFEPFLQKYLRLAEFIIGLAAGAIVLIIGASFYHGDGGHLPWTFASPLLVLAVSILASLGFMAWQILSYENTQHGCKHTARDYSLSEALGWGSLLFFFIGYVWLILAATH